MTQLNLPGCVWTQGYLLLPLGLVRSSFAGSQQNRRPIFLCGILRWIWHELTSHWCDAMTVHLSLVSMDLETHGQAEMCLGIMTQSMGPKPTTRLWSRNLACYSPSIKHYPMAQNHERPFPAQSHEWYFFSLSTMGHKWFGSLRQWPWFLPCTLVDCGLVLLPCLLSSMLSAKSLLFSTSSKTG